MYPSCLYYETKETESLTKAEHSVSFPELTSLADPWALNYHPGSNFSLWGEAVALNLPKLATVDGSVAFGGNFSSFVPLLITVPYLYVKV